MSGKYIRSYHIPELWLLQQYMIIHPVYAGIGKGSLHKVYDRYQRHKEKLRYQG